jgi:medium-chain acyl-[acyl-carrier-protein] hydrolase
LARRLRRDGREPLHLIVSALRPPQLLPPLPRLHGLPANRFIEMLISLNGMPLELINEPEILKIVLPTLRADFEAYETYEYRSEAPLRCPISAYSGRSDPTAPPHQMKFWSDHTVGRFSCRLFPGDHFFFENSRRSVLSAVSVDLLSTLIRTQQNSHSQSAGASK